MKSAFEKWRKVIDGFIRREYLGEPSAKAGWNACKNEVLKILEKECYLSANYNIKELRDEIENL